MVIPGSGIMGTSGMTLDVNLSAGGVLGDPAGSTAMFSLNGNHAALSLSRCNGMSVGVGVAIPVLGIMGSIGAALLANLSAGSVVNDVAGWPAIFSVNGNHAAGSFTRDNGVTADVGVVIPVLGMVGTSGIALLVNLSAGSMVND